MSTPLSEQVAAAAAELRQQQERLAAIQDQLSGAGASATSADHMVTVTLDGRGEVHDVTFHTTRFRKLAPAELGAAIVATIRSARADALKRTFAAYQQFLPAGLDLRKVMAGDFDIDDLFAEAVRVAGEPIPGENDPTSGAAGGAGTGARRG